MNLQEYQGEVATGRILIDFWAEWCGPCKIVEPVLEKIAEEHNLRILKINIDDSMDLAQTLGVRSIPTIQLVEDGIVLATAIGSYPRLGLEKALGLSSE